MMISIMIMMMMMMTTRMMFINDLIDQSIEIRFLTAAAARMRIRKAKPTSGHLEPTSGHLDGERMSERRPSIMKIENIKFKNAKPTSGHLELKRPKQKQRQKKKINSCTLRTRSTSTTRQRLELENQDEINDQKSSCSIKFLTGAGFYRQLWKRVKMKTSKILIFH